MVTTTPKSAKSEVGLRVEKALVYPGRNPDAKFATVARQFNVPRSRLQRRIQGISPRNGLPATNTKLTREEEEALCRQIDRLDNANFGVQPEFITDAANYIVQEQSSSSLSSLPTVGKKWTTRFIKRKGYTKKLPKKLDSNRQASEDTERVTIYFQKLQEAITNEGIPPDDIWNMDEIGYRIGIGMYRLTVTKRNRTHLSIQTI